MSKEKRDLIEFIFIILALIISIILGIISKF